MELAISNKINMNTNSQLQINYLLHLADTTLILSQRNSEWCGHGPILEQDIAITNISLDLLGQARTLYQYAAILLNKDAKVLPLEEYREATEDSLAYLRNEREFKNLLLVEQPKGNWATTVLRQYLFSQFQFELFLVLQNSSDAQLAAIATKSIKETAYHVRWSKEWVIRLGDGTTESHHKMIEAVETIWQYTGEMFEPADYETLQQINLQILKNIWEEKVAQVFQEAKLSMPENAFVQVGGKQGTHTEYLGFILAEMQYLQRSYPNAVW
jgi:ring-1,2-phenylacetyl-CoA epoxidase subunit PaaC